MARTELNTYCRVPIRKVRIAGPRTHISGAFSAIEPCRNGMLEPSSGVGGGSYFVWNTLLHALTGNAGRRPAPSLSNCKPARSVSTTSQSVSVEDVKPILSDLGNLNGDEAVENPEAPCGELGKRLAAASLLIGEWEKKGIDPDLVKVGVVCLTNLAQAMKPEDVEQVIKEFNEYFVDIGNKLKVGKFKRLVMPSMGDMSSTVQTVLAEISAGTTAPHFQQDEIIEKFNSERNDAKIRAASKVYYLSEEKLKYYQLVVRGGLFYQYDERNSSGIPGAKLKLADTRKNQEHYAQRDFVMDTHGNLFLAPSIDDTGLTKDDPRKIDLDTYLGLRHSSYLRGGPTGCAGTCVFKDGRMVVLTNLSGHYQPEEYHLWQVEEQLLRLGILPDKLPRVLFFTQKQIQQSKFEGGDLEYLTLKALLNYYDEEILTSEKTL